MSRPSDDYPSELLAGRYRVIEKLGQGGMGLVYLAEDVEIGERVAVKMIPPSLAGNRTTLHNLRREVALAHKLAHDNIVRIYDLHGEGHEKFITMEYVAGRTLDHLIADRLEQGQVMTLEEALPMARQVAAALDYAHGQGIFHRDIKPTNIMVGPNGRVKVLDFGIAREMKDSYTRLTGNETSGTLPYMSPQQLMGDKPDARMDIYSLGCVLYECLAGHPPFYTGDIREQIKSRKADPIDAVSKAANNAILMALAKLPELRQGTAGELVEELTAGGGGYETLDGQKTQVLKREERPGAKPGRGGLVKMLAGGLVAVLLLVGGIYWWQNREDTRSMPDRGQNEITHNTDPVTPVVSVKQPMEQLREAYPNLADLEEVDFLKQVYLQQADCLDWPAYLSAYELGKEIENPFGALDAGQSKLGAQDARKVAEAQEARLHAKATMAQADSCYNGGLEYDRSGDYARAVWSYQQAAQGYSGAQAETGRVLEELVIYDAAREKMTQAKVRAQHWQTAEIADSQHRSQTAAEKEASLGALSADRRLEAAGVMNDVTDLYELAVQESQAAWRQRLTEAQENAQAVLAAAQNDAKVQEFCSEELDRLRQDYKEIVRADADLPSVCQQFNDISEAAGQLSAQAAGREQVQLKELAEAAAEQMKRRMSGYDTDLMQRYGGENWKALERLMAEAAAAFEKADYKSVLSLMKEILGSLDEVDRIAHAREVYASELFRLAQACDDITSASKGLEMLNKLLEINAAYPEANQLKAKLERYLEPEPGDIMTNSIGMKLVWIPSGEFKLGSRLSHSEIARKFNVEEDYIITDDRPQHTERIDAGYWLGQYEVNIEQFQQFVIASHYVTIQEKKGGNINWKQPGYQQGTDHPVVCIAWEDAIAFCEWLSNKEGRLYTLPTEAQWEYACRSGTDTLYFWGDNPDNHGYYGNMADISFKNKFPKSPTSSSRDGFIYTSKQGSFQPNRWNLYDMHGNVYEWSWNWYDNSSGSGSKLSRGTKGILRGGSWTSAPFDCRSAARISDTRFIRTEIIGFRVLLMHFL